MNSEQSTGTSGYETLSRKGTLVLGPHILDKYKVNQDVLRELENTSRQSVSATFIATDVAESFLASCQYSELLQNLPAPYKSRSRIEDSEVKDDISKADISKKVSGSSIDSFFSNSSYSFSQLHLYLTEDYSGDFEMSSKVNKRRSGQGGDKDIFKETMHSSYDSEGLFRYSGHVDVAETTMSVRVFATLEVTRENSHCLDPIVLANTYCRQLVKSNMLVLMLTEKNIAEFKRRGLLEYIRKYWAGYFSVLLVVIGSKIRVIEEDQLIYNLGRVFSCVETLYVEDDSKMAGHVFSALARMGMGLDIRSCKDWTILC